MRIAGTSRDGKRCLGAEFDRKDLDGVCNVRRVKKMWKCQIGNHMICCLRDLGDAQRSIGSLMRLYV